MTSSGATSGPGLLRKVFVEVATRVDGAVLVSSRLQQSLTDSFTAVLAIGKVSFPMFNGLFAEAPRINKGLLVAPATRFPEKVQLPIGVQALVSDHPNPSERSRAAGEAAFAFVQGLNADDQLLVLLSGGGSSLVCAPAVGLTLDDKRAAVKAVSRNGASIGELNTVRKHLSRLKGGQLGVATKARTHVWSLSDVVGNDPATIASGPFSPDPTTFAQAQALLQRLAPDAPAAVVEHLRKGAQGLLPETPKPEDGRLNHVAYEILAGPEIVVTEARAAVEAHGVLAGLLSQNVESDVHALAQAYVDRALRERSAGGKPRVFVGNGEPSIVVTGSGKGGRATHLALLVARGIAGQAGVAFLAAGTDDRDGSADASGAVVDGDTWNLAVARGLAPEQALANSDSATVLGALGALVKGPGTSNLLDLHLLLVG
ncbi:MAG: DUF4147 domain-containing protein [Deltaproteobacteria bacterium]|nr:DUF4147 domain-containing protein [Deltaproteobacteria bacterium]